MEGGWLRHDHHGRLLVGQRKVKTCLVFGISIKVNMDRHDTIIIGDYCIHIREGFTRNSLFVSTVHPRSVLLTVSLIHIFIITRAPDGQLLPDPERFPSGIPALANYVHKLQLKFGIYQVKPWQHLVTPGNTVARVIIIIIFSGLRDKDLRRVGFVSLR